MTHKTTSVQVQIDLPPKDEDSALFILGRNHCEHVSHPELFGMNLYDSEFDSCCMWDGIDYFEIGDLDYNGHFGYSVFFNTPPELQERNAKIVKELIQLWIDTFTTLRVNDDEVRFSMTADAVQGRIREMIEEDKA